ncbi:hypothetical protein EV644_104145 [Kribbella orskensis]|uniref:Lipoprotein n=1 Tax=Kribbella orskensis TaxID=2512216 RepID=A0ABY2BPH6_9ACTN|nr:MULTISPECIES: hypothetical protein [Kribbella]TCN41763.1 hypothetical protein EV642_103145 [Kribbella sp. VKM Ac-2500]TCO25641.1 hypothetical protein EV644_104145 [Kribbella orskensis]
MPVHRLTTIAIAAVVSLALVGCEPIETTSRSTKGSSSKSSSSKTSGNSGKSSTKSRASVKITASDKVCWAGKVGGQTKKGCGNATIQVRDSKGTYRIQLRKTKGSGTLKVVLIVNGDRVDSGSITSSSSAVSISYANR